MLAAALASAVLGVLTYYSVPRHQDHDYRAIVGHVIERGTPSDTVFALFPWQIGYWRAYAPRDLEGRPFPHNPNQSDKKPWNGMTLSVLALERALQRGTIWFPAPLSFGSSLPCRSRTVPAGSCGECRGQLVWWRHQAQCLVISVKPSTPRNGQTHLGSVELHRAGVEPRTANSANEVLNVALGLEDAGLVQINSTLHWRSLILLGANGPNETTNPWGAFLFAGTRLRKLYSGLHRCSWIPGAGRTAPRSLHADCRHSSS